MIYDLFEKLKEQDSLKGIDINKLEIGQRVIVETKNTTYTLDRIEGDRRVRVQGGEYFPEPKDAILVGSTFGGSIIKIGWIGYSMQMEIAFDNQVVTTSPAKAASVKGGVWECQMEWPESP